MLYLVSFGEVAGGRRRGKIMLFLGYYKNAQPPNENMWLSKVSVGRRKNIESLGWKEVFCSRQETLYYPGQIVVQFVVESFQ